MKRATFTLAGLIFTGTVIAQDLPPGAAELRLVMYSGEINHNRIEFTHCRCLGPRARSTLMRRIRLNKLPASELRRSTKRCGHCPAAWRSR